MVKCAGASMNRNGSIHIGTSGWHYAHWKGPFYPENLASAHFLAYYAERFQAAEINNTFYHLPQETTFVEWRETVSTGFVFAVKASRYITHMKKLQEPQKTLPLFFKRVELLQEKLGPILFQLPPYWHFNLERLKNFLKALPADFKYAFEFRDESWFNSGTNEALAEKGAAFCIYDFAGSQSPRTVTSDLVYVRLHGPEVAYSGQYDDGTLREWAEAFSAWARQGKEVHCYFDNDEAGYAVQDALRLKGMVGEG